MTRSEIDLFFRNLGPNALYALCDHALLDAFGIEMQQFVSRARRKGAVMIQYRNKRDPLHEVEQHLIQLRALWEGVLIVNDHWTLHTGCDGIHIGQDDLAAWGKTVEAAAARLRRTVGQGCIIGLSTHNAAEIAAANGLPVDYIGLGAYRATQTKEDAGVLGEALETLAARSVHPVAAIGGVRLEDRFDGVAMRVVGSALCKGQPSWK